MFLPAEGIRSDMVSQAKVRDKDKDIVKLKRYDYGYEIGLVLILPDLF